ncbi:hypothetical protein GWK48_06575 [Metallosphaera tengchongensis]|uniref:Multipass membrane protein n=1 Tax=Metallosphaera tengchongensis TaxID=1532350 RepID=A0A6N0NYZ7_9CREN|nr:hypothetical protein [Metallosphaera tengchongensis]QKR01043.1 hypothetical protein GWK48_06575 [Metallosphaera tengchongensis]
MSVETQVYKLMDLVSRHNYVTGLSMLEVLTLIGLYSAGMSIPIFNLGLQGAAITAHIYGAITIAILGILILAAAMRTNEMGLKFLSLLNVLFILVAAFEGLFYFGGFIDPSYALGMGVGFVGTLFAGTGVLFYCLSR